MGGVSGWMGEGRGVRRVCVAGGREVCQGSMCVSVGCMVELNHLVSGS